MKNKLAQLLAALITVSMAGAAFGYPFVGGGGGAGGGGGTPGGSSGQIQYNNAGVFGGLSNGNCITINSATLNTATPNRVVTASTDTITANDSCGVVQYNRGSSVAVGIAPASNAALGSGFTFEMDNIGAGTVTLTPTTSTINGSSSLAIPTNTGCLIYSDGTNYQVAYASCTVLGGNPLTVSYGGTGLASGTSGGIPAYTGTTTLSSSGVLTANLPVIGGGAGVAPSVGTVSGNTTEFVTTTGALVNGDCVSIDGSGNFVDAGGACTTGGGGGTVASSTTGQVPVYTAATTVTGATAMTYSAGGLSLGTANTTQGSVKLYGSTSGNVTLGTAAAAGTNVTFNLPTTNGTNTYVLQTDGSGNTSWVAAGGGVSSFSGDSTLLSNSSSTGAVTATLANAAANSVWGNNTGSSAAPGYQTSFGVLEGNSITGNTTASQYSLLMNSVPYAGGTATTNFPLLGLVTTGATASSKWSTAGTFFGINSASGFTGNLIDAHINNGNSVFAVTYQGAVSAGTITGSTITASGGNVVSTNNGGKITGASFWSTGTKFTLSTNTCSGTSTAGGATAGQFASGTTGACTFTVTMAGATGISATNGWACYVNDISTGVTGAQTGSTQTTASFSVATTSGDTVNFSCMGY